MESFLELRGLTKTYGRTTAVDDVSLSIAKGEFTTLLGPSGSGKSTVLMMIAGFADPTAGAILLQGKDITQVAPERRNFGMVFQGYALFPHLSVGANVGFPLKVRGCQSSEIQDRVKRALDMVRMAHLADRMPKQLSGGQQQRVAIARALVFDPDLLLLDEPLSALDKKLRGEVQQELKDLHARLGMTFVCVTHDQDEALSLADRVVILQDGKVQQAGSPIELYERPGNRFVAGFLGRSNLLEVRMLRRDARGGSYVLDGIELLHHGRPSPAAVGDQVHLSLRPEKIHVGVERPVPGPNAIHGQIAGASYTGAKHELRVQCGNMQLLAELASWGAPDVRVGQAVWLSWPADATVVLDDK